MNAAKIGESLKSLFHPVDNTATEFYVPYSELLKLLTDMRLEADKLDTFQAGIDAVLETGLAGKASLDQRRLTREQLKAARQKFLEQQPLFNIGDQAVLHDLIEIIGGYTMQGSMFLSGPRGLTGYCNALIEKIVKNETHLIFRGEKQPICVNTPSQFDGKAWTPKGCKPDLQGVQTSGVYIHPATVPVQNAVPTEALVARPA